MTNVHIVILGLLHKKPLHGYEVKHIIEDHMGDWTDIKFGSIYFALRKLKDEGKVAIQEEVSSGNRPVRKVYRITQQGKDEYLRLLREMWTHQKQSLYPLDIAVFFINSLPKDEVLQHIKTRIYECEKTLKYLLNHENEHKHNSHIPRQGFYIFDHSKMHLEAELNWLKKVAADLEYKEYKE